MLPLILKPYKKKQEKHSCKIVLDPNWACQARPCPTLPDNLSTLPDCARPFPTSPGRTRQRIEPDIPDRARPWPTEPDRTRPVGVRRLGSGTHVGGGLLIRKWITRSLPNIFLYSIFRLSSVSHRLEQWLKTVETRAYNMHYNEILKRHIWRQIFAFVYWC